MTKSNDLTIKSSKNTKKVTKVKEISNSGFLRTNGEYYIYTVASNGKISYSKKNIGVSSIVGDAFYIKSGKTYSVYTNKKVFDTTITKVVGGFKSGYVLTSGGIIKQQTESINF